MTFAQVTYSTKVGLYLVSRKIPFKLKVVSAWKTTVFVFSGASQQVSVCDAAGGSQSPRRVWRRRPTPQFRKT